MYDIKGFMKRYAKKLKIGLIVGKFAPLHKGHQLLIEAALKKMNKVIVLVYNGPKNLQIPLRKRVNWLRSLYPMIKVVSGKNAPFEKGKNPKIAQKNIKYIKRVIRFPITHVFSSEKYGVLLSRALGAKNILVDEKRKRFPISATQIRTSPQKHKKFLEPKIYQEITKPAP